MMPHTIFPKLEIPNTIAAGPGPGNTDERVLQAFANAGIADHMQADVLRGMTECKLMLRNVFGTKNIYTYGVAGTGFSALDCMFSAVMPGDSVVAFTNGTFSGIDATALQMKAASAQELAANPLQPDAASVVVIEVPHGQSVTDKIVADALAEHKPKWAFMAHWETGSGRINDIVGFSNACLKHDVLGLIDAVSSLGVEDFSIDDYAGVVGWASCPQKGMLCLPLTYAPVSFNQRYIDAVKASGCRTYAHHPLLEARHWGIADGEDVEKGSYHRTHSGYAVAAFHEALRITLQEGLTTRSENYAYHEKALTNAVTEMGCYVTSNMTSLVVLNLPKNLAGREMELVQACRSDGFGIWPTLSSPVQIRIGILNLLTKANIAEIVTLFAQAMNTMGADLDLDAINTRLTSYYSN